MFPVRLLVEAAWNVCIDFEARCCAIALALPPSWIRHFCLSLHLSCLSGAVVQPQLGQAAALALALAAAAAAAV